MAKVIANMDSLLKKLDRLGGDTKNAIVKAMKTTLQSAEGDAKANSMYGSVRTTIKSQFKVEPDSIEGEVFSNHPAAQYIEFGTGPKGQADHAGISPNIPVTYTQHPWVYHSEDYGFVTTSGQPARPFLYPAAKQNESVFEGETRKELLSAIMKAGG